MAGVIGSVVKDVGELICRWCGREVFRHYGYPTGSIKWSHGDGDIYCVEVGGRVRPATPIDWVDATPVEVCVNCGGVITEGTGYGTGWVHGNGRYFCPGTNGDGSYGSMRLARPPAWADVSGTEWWE